MSDANADIRAAEHVRPRHYVCYRSDEQLAVDGRAAEAIWSRAPWSEDFVDIEGDGRYRPTFRTRFRMLHDRTHLHVHAELEEPHVRATITRRNAVIFHDNDFEIFLDPDGDNHDYYELEVNALNTVWELSLPTPYRTGATPRDPDPIEGLRTAVHVDGTLNDPRDEDRGWSVHAAIPFSGLTRFTQDGVACPPVDGTIWRMNFSRVQWPREVAGGAYRTVPNAREDNWVWSPQGVVDMHRPATWGFVQFSDRIAGSGEVAWRGDPTLPARNLLMGIWERQRLRDAPADDAAALGLSGPDRGIRIVRDGERWTASMPVETLGGRLLVAVDETARLTVRSIDERVR